MKTIESGLQAKNASIAIIIARFNKFFNDYLLNGALDVLNRIGKINEENILKIYVPGAYEIPTIAHCIAKSKKYDAIISIGTIMKGQTQHFKNISHDTTSNLAKISIEYLIPITLGLVITDNIEQSIDRSGAKMGNKGSEAALSALEMINIMKKIKKQLDI